MALSTVVRSRLNRVLSLVNLRVETLTAETMERKRLQALVDQQHFTKPVFRVPPAFQMASHEAIFSYVDDYVQCLARFCDATTNDVGYSYANGYFSSPDAEVLYTMVRSLRPAHIVEVGSGHSTRLMRQAIIDGGLSTHLTSVDPSPRVDVRGFADEIHTARAETCDPRLVDALAANDILFIDSSHLLEPGNDVTMLYLQWLPRLQNGVVVHIHDVFLPYEYPAEWLVENRWHLNEQYLVQAILTAGGAFDVLWAGYFAQKTRADFAEHFPNLNGGRAQSLWLRKNSSLSATAA